MCFFLSASRNCFRSTSRLDPHPHILCVTVVPDGGFYEDLSQNYSKLAMVFVVVFIANSYTYMEDVLFPWHSLVVNTGITTQVCSSDYKTPQLQYQGWKKCR